MDMVKVYLDMGDIYRLWVNLRVDIKGLDDRVDNKIDILSEKIRELSLDLCDVIGVKVESMEEEMIVNEE